MTVAELIALLGNYPPDLPVWVIDNDDGVWAPVKSAYLDKGDEDYPEPCLLIMAND